MRIEKETWKFLKSLQKNNNREWFEAHRKDYTFAKDNVIAFIAAVLADMGKFDPAVLAVEPKSTLFRINRDVRFSKDKSPYKTNFGAVLSAGGKKAVGPGYYLHLEPGGKTIVGGGIWMPEPAALASIRQEIDYNLKEFEGIVKDKNFKKQFGALSDNALKTKPKGYDADNPALPYLKQKSFVAFHTFDDEAVFTPTFQKSCVTSFQALQPMHAFLQRALQ